MVKPPDKKQQERMSPQEVVEMLRAGNRRFLAGERLARDLVQQVAATSAEQNPLALILSCIDSRVPAELVFDLGIGDVFSVRVAGNIIGTKSLGSIEFGMVVAGVKLVLVLGHTRCGAVTASVQLIGKNQHAADETGCSHLQAIVAEIEPSTNIQECRDALALSPQGIESFIDEVARRNVIRTVSEISTCSGPIQQEIKAGRVVLLGAMYDVNSGKVEFLGEEDQEIL